MLRSTRRGSFATVGAVTGTVAVAGIAGAGSSTAGVGGGKGGGLTTVGVTGGALDVS